MAVEVIFPKVDMDMDKGTISKWLVKDGDTVKKGQAVFEIETDKSAMEIEAPADGVVKLAQLDEGQSVNIGTVVAKIFAAGEDVKSFSAAPAVTPAKVGPQPEAKLDPVKLRDDLSANRGIRATPLARRLAKQQEIEIETLKGSGPRGRILAADIKVPKPSAAPQLASSNQASAIRKLYEEGSYSIQPLDSMRRTIAQRLTESKQTVPHFYLSATCTIDALLAVRERINASAPLGVDKKPHWKLSINDFVIKAFALALQRVPSANATFTNDGILLHRASDVGVAVSVEGGLFTPIIRQAETKTLSAISLEMKELAAKARARKLQPNDYQGGSAAISNLGMYGVEQFTAIINPPQASILAVGAAIERFVPVKRQPVLVTQVAVTLSVDHRAIDGATGAELLAAFKALIEDPALMLV
jgi:pyruvate dehydrogenase E2 component (dihydrolipoamide acetyltransferase)